MSLTLENINNWDGKSKWRNLIKPSNEMNSIVKGVKHPVIKEFLNKGYNYQECLSLYNFTVEQFIELSKFFDTYIHNSEINIQSIDDDYLKLENDSGIKYGDVLIKILNKHNNEEYQLFIMHYFIDSDWYKYMRYKLTYGNKTDIELFKLDFFSDDLKINLLDN